MQLSLQAGFVFSPLPPNRLVASLVLSPVCRARCTANWDAPHSTRPRSSSSAEASSAECAGWQLLRHNLRIPDAALQKRRHSSTHHQVCLHCILQMLAVALCYKLSRTAYHYEIRAGCEALRCSWVHCYARSRFLPTRLVIYCCPSSLDAIGRLFFCLTQPSSTAQGTKPGPNRLQTLISSSSFPTRHRGHRLAEDLVESSIQGLFHVRARKWPFNCCVYSPCVTFARLSLGRATTASVPSL